MQRQCPAAASNRHCWLSVVDVQSASSTHVSFEVRQKYPMDAGSGDPGQREVEGEQ
jgi:hypothetical protein